MTDDAGRRFVDGDEEAFETLFREWQSRVFRWAMSIVRNPTAAEDVTVETFWRAYRSRAKFDPSRPFGPWVRRIATNVALEWLRGAQRERSRVAPLADDMAAKPPAESNAQPDVTAALHRLPPKLRVVVMLGLIEEEPYADIAEALGISVSAVKVRMFRAVRLLEQELTRLGVRP